MSEKELREALQAILDKVQVIAGSALASIPAEPEQADEVAGLDAIVLAQVLAFLGGSPGFSPAFVTDAQTELALRIAAAYPLAVEYRARLAPARDDTSGGAS